ncbi:glycoside hydrolase family 15 protein [Paenibacillus radicis (ex Xue et al. 2023)]|uniref:Glycoside hydrolase family 15 protein n=1 Tax=Paenibacillus radicis (ex Xue et al. 2023) TaxID=2972489 RepID=A0ABT1YPA1_9BACL|nr:glycoside hydrolase family 15 protein [Paenibacillus radicis (ex Xue et al. 2023)]MCR8635004.1 glycoside hydrolase family 15 protein [Paenibacillus radicis (ex Xue et al. 2023)]
MKGNCSFTSRQLALTSKQIIRLNQHPSGGYAASPLFSHYTFSWLRDGSFIAYAMDVAGETESAELYYQWVNQVLSRQQGHVDYLLQKHERGETIEQHEFLNTRYHLDGRDDDHSEWGHFQLDGYGAWLWGLAEHCTRLGLTVIPERYQQSVELTVRYLCAFWRQPNFDCWEERNDQLHPSTLACIYGGLSAIRNFTGDAGLDGICADIRRFILDHAVHPEAGHFVKSIRPTSDNDRYELSYDGVDASLLWLCEPFHVFAPDHPIMAATIAKIEADLKTAHGGIRRYCTDEYYGGGEWILLTAWYGWVCHHAGKDTEAGQALQWIIDQSDELGRLPEQVPHALTELHTYEQWVERWGTPAMPLLWSHAMYLVLNSQLNG